MMNKEKRGGNGKINHNVSKIEKLYELYEIKFQTNYNTRSVTRISKSYKRVLYLNTKNYRLNKFE